MIKRLPTKYEMQEAKHNRAKRIVDICCGFALAALIISAWFAR